MAFLDRSIFQAAANGTGDFVEAAAVPGYQTMEAAGAVDGTTYSYVAQSADLTQWEYGRAVYTAVTHSLDRSQVLGNDLNTTSKINFTAAPQVLLTVLGEDISALSPTPAGSNLNFYVATTGSDSNPGTIGSPFATIGHALNVTTLYDYQGLYFPTIFIADGTYNESIVLPELTNPLGGLEACSALIISSSDVSSAVLIQPTVATPNNAVIYGSSYCSWTISTVSIDGSMSSAGAVKTNDFGFVQCRAGSLTVADEATVFDAHGRLSFIGVAIDDHSILNFYGAPSIIFSFADATNYGSQVQISGPVTMQASFSIDAAWLRVLGPYSSIATTALYDPNGHTIGGAPQFVVNDYGVIDTDLSLLSSIPGSGTTISFTGTHNNTWGGSKTVLVPSTGDTFDMNPGQNYLILNPAGTLATLTVDLPTTPVDFQKAVISTTQIITALTVATTDGSTAVAPPTTLTAGQAFTMIYDLASNSWYPSQ